MTDRSLLGGEESVAGEKGVAGEESVVREEGSAPAAD